MGDGFFSKIKWIFITWLSRRLPDCKRMTKQIGESLDREQNWLEALIMKLHLFTCEACERYLHHVAFLRDAMSVHSTGLDETSIDTTLSRESKERIKTLLRSLVLCQAHRE